MSWYVPLNSRFIIAQNDSMPFVCAYSLNSDLNSYLVRCDGEGCPDGPEPRQ